MVVALDDDDDMVVVVIVVVGTDDIGVVTVPSFVAGDGDDMDGGFLLFCFVFCFFFVYLFFCVVVVTKLFNTGWGGLLLRLRVSCFWTDEVQFRTTPAVIGLSYTIVEKFKSWHRFGRKSSTTTTTTMVMMMTTTRAGGGWLSSFVVINTWGGVG